MNNLLAEQQSPRDFNINEKLNNSNLYKSLVYPNQRGVGNKIKYLENTNIWKRKKEKNRHIEIERERKY